MKRIAFVILLLASCQPESRPPAYMTDAPRTGEDNARALAEIRAELGKDFEVTIVEDIFFLAVNGGSRNVTEASGTIRRVCRFLWKEYFAKKPTRPIRVYCFKNKETYDGYVRKTYQREPSTPYGFYMPGERKMIMNLATGTGTLAHEVVHPLLAEDFPGVPSWFNEGFASLYEQSTTQNDGTIVGLVNWRLGGLHRAMRAGRSMTLEALMKTNADDFYNDEEGVHYSTARYLCMYLQEERKLIPFYKAFRDNREDFTGKASLEKIMGRALAPFEKDWRKWVVNLQ